MLHLLWNTIDLPTTLSKGDTRMLPIAICNCCLPKLNEDIYSVFASLLQVLRLRSVCKVVANSSRLHLQR